MEKVTINCDMGEAFGIHRFGDDEAYVTHANIACGFHASDPMVMWKTVRDARRRGLNIESQDRRCSVRFKALWGLCCARSGLRWGRRAGLRCSTGPGARAAR